VSLQPIQQLPHLSTRGDEAGTRTHRITTTIDIGRQRWIECACGFFGEVLAGGTDGCRVAGIERDLVAKVATLAADTEAKVARLLVLADSERREFEQASRAGSRVGVVEGARRGGTPSTR
jgi:hypothetical protein